MEPNLSQLQIAIRNSKIFINGKVFNTVTCKMAAILTQPQCVMIGK